MTPERDRYVVECEKTIAALREELRLQNEANDMLAAERDSWCDRARRAEADTQSAFDLSRECRERAVKAEADNAALRQMNDLLRSALKQSVELQSHYAMLLNDWDGGIRLRFNSEEDWLQRLAMLAGKKP